jgi:hypothetical protein
MGKGRYKPIASICDMCSSSSIFVKIKGTGFIKKTVNFVTSRFCLFFFDGCVIYVCG